MRFLNPRPVAAALLLAVALPTPASACDGWGVRFRNGSSTLSRQAERGLSRFLVIAAEMERTGADYREHPYRYRITGYADWRGTPDPLLARRRAEVVRSKLVRLGLPAAKIAIGATPRNRVPGDDAVIAFGPPQGMCGG